MRLSSFNSQRKMLLLFTCLWSMISAAQITADRLQQFIAARNDGDITSAKEFYSKLDYQPVWLESENNFSILFNELKLSAQRGLKQSDYQFSFIDSVFKKSVYLQNIIDSIEAEIRIANAAIRFYNDIAHGNTVPSLGYDGLNYTPNCHNIPLLLAEAISNHSLISLPARISPSLAEIKAIENRIRKLTTIIADSNFKEVNITSTKVIHTNKALVTKLYQLGIIDSVNNIIPDSTIRQKVKEAQRQFNLMADGVLRSTIMQELNRPITVRLQQLSLSVNYYRWLYCLAQQQSVVVVNIPATYLKVYKGNQVILEMRMIVGAKATRTPTLASVINEVILYPYWHVPYSIATKELLPAIKENPSYIDVGNFQVLNRAGKIMDPYSINWHVYSTKYFPFVIRQSTGCDNALGLLKLNFYNPFGVYLHDTPTKSLFMLNKRYFSHGCMRMEKPMELGHMVLKNNPHAIDTLEEKGCLRNQSPIIVPADIHMPVVVWYNPAGIDSTGRVLFFEDIYEKFTWMKKASR
jgi:L,D-transpeptidase YcbB